MTSILERNKNLKKPVAKTREEYAEDALYREVWEDVNNEKTQQFLKKYWRHIAAAIMGIMIIVCGIQIGWNMHVKSKMTMARAYEVALQAKDAQALANLAKSSSNATSDLALARSYLIDKDISKLEYLAESGSTVDFRDWAKIHLATIKGDKMEVKEFEEFLSGMNTKNSPYYYTARLLVAGKYLSVNDREHADTILDEIIKDSDAPDAVKNEAQLLK